MTQKADHPHQSAVHLVSALKCCRDCYDVSQVDYAELGELQFEKDSLARQLGKFQNLEEDRIRINAEIQDLNFLITKVRQQNQVAYQDGLNQIDQMTLDRQMFEKNHRDSFHLQMTAQKQRSRTMMRQIEQLTQKIRYMHRINEELVNKFCKY